MIGLSWTAACENNATLAYIGAVGFVISATIAILCLVFTLFPRACDEGEE